MKFTEPVVLSKLVLNSVAKMLLFSLLKKLIHSGCIVGKEELQL